MLIRLFRSGYFIKIFMFLMISFLLWAPAFLHPPAAVSSETDGIAYKLLLPLIDFPSLIIVIIAFIILIIQAIVLNYILIENPIFSKSVFLPALIYVILMSYNPLYLSLSPVLATNFFLIFSLKNLFNTYGKTEAFREAFNASFWVSVSSLFYFPSVFFITFIWAAFLIFRISSWREWIISFIGLCMPYLIILIICFLSDELGYLNDYASRLSWISPGFDLTLQDYLFWPFFIVFLIVAHSKFIVGRYDKIISIRKAFAVVDVFLIISIISFMLSGVEAHWHTCLIFPASSVIISYYFIEAKKIIIAELLLSILLIVIVTIKFL